MAKQQAEWALPGKINVPGLAACKTLASQAYETPVPLNTSRKEDLEERYGLRACREEGRGTTPRTPVDGRPADAGRPRRPPEASGRIPLGNRAAPVISAKRGGYLHHRAGHRNAAK